MEGGSSDFCGEPSLQNSLSTCSPAEVGNYNLGCNKDEKRMQLSPNSSSSSNNNNKLEEHVQSYLVSGQSDTSGLDWHLPYALYNSRKLEESGYYRCNQDSLLGQSLTATMSKISSGPGFQGDSVENSVKPNIVIHHHPNQFQPGSSGGHSIQQPQPQPSDFSWTNWTPKSDVKPLFPVLPNPDVSKTPDSSSNVPDTKAEFGGIVQRTETEEKKQLPFIALPPADELNYFPKRYTNQARNKRKQQLQQEERTKTEPEMTPGGEQQQQQQQQQQQSQQSQQHARPAYSYVMMIAMAIRASPQKRLPLRKIYEYISDKFPHFKLDAGGWKNSVRHNLSLNECFMKQPRQPGEGKGHNWCIKPGFEEDFENCENDAEGFKKRRRRKNAKKTSKSLYSKNLANAATAYIARMPRNTMPAVLPSHCLSSPWNHDYSSMYQSRVSAAAAAGGWKYLENLSDHYRSVAAAAGSSKQAVVAAAAAEASMPTYGINQIPTQNAFAGSYTSYSNALLGSAGHDLSTGRLSSQNLFLGQFPGQLDASGFPTHAQFNDYAWPSN